MNAVGALDPFSLIHVSPRHPRPRFSVQAQAVVSDFLMRASAELSASSGLQVWLAIAPEHTRSEAAWVLEVQTSTAYGEVVFSFPESFVQNVTAALGKGDHRSGDLSSEQNADEAAALFLHDVLLLLSKKSLALLFPGHITSVQRVCGGSVDKALPIACCIEGRESLFGVQVSASFLKRLPPSAGRLRAPKSSFRFFSVPAVDAAFILRWDAMSLWDLRTLHVGKKLSLADASHAELIPLAPAGAEPLLLGGTVKLVRENHETMMRFECGGST